MMTAPDVREIERLYDERITDTRTEEIHRKADKVLDDAEKVAQHGHHVLAALQKVVTDLYVERGSDKRG